MLTLDQCKAGIQRKLDTATADHNLYGTILHTPGWASANEATAAWIAARYAEAGEAIAAVTDELAVLNTH